MPIDNDVMVIAAAGMITKLDAEFDQYFTMVFPGASKEQRIDLRRTYFAGGWSVIKEILEAMNDRIPAATLVKIAAAATGAVMEDYNEMAMKDIAAAEGKPPQ